MVHTGIHGPCLDNALPIRGQATWTEGPRHAMAGRLRRNPRQTQRYVPAQGPASAVAILFTACNENVDRVIGARQLQYGMNGTCQEYLIVFKGRRSSRGTWTPSSLCNCDDLIMSFLDHQLDHVRCVLEGR